VCEVGTCRLGICETGGFGGSAAGGNAAGGNTAGGNTAGGNTAGGNTAGGNAAGGNAAGGNAAGGNAAGGNAAGGNAAGGNAAGGNAAGGNAAGGNAACTPACPSGFACTAGVCSGGNLSSVALNVATAPLTLDLRANGAPLPMTCGFNDIVGRVDVIDGGDRLAGTPFFRACNSPLITTSRHPDPSTISTRLSGNGLIPFPGSFTGPDILVSGPTTRTIDVTMVPVTGRVLANGAPVSCSTAGAGLGTLSFVNTGVRIDVDVTCTQNRAGFSASLPIRNYRVYFTGRVPNSSLPDGVPSLVAANLQVSAGTATAMLDLNTVSAPVTFTIRQNGAPITCPSTGGGISYGFIPEGDLYLNGYGASCVPGVGYRFTHRVSPGNWSFDLESSPNAILPNGYDYRTPVTVSATDTAVNIDLTTVEVSGTISVNGAPLTNCATADRVQVFTDDFASFDLPITCGATTTFRGRVPAGTHEFLVLSEANQWPQGVYWSQRLQAVPSINFALATRVASFSVLANGAPPQSTCTAPGLKASYELRADDAGGTNGDISVPCSMTGFTRSAVIFEGRSHVSVRSSRSTLPAVDRGHVFDSRSSSAFVVDIPVRRVTGTLTVNGASAGCVTPDNGQLADRTVQPSSPGGPLQCVQGSWTFELWGRPGVWTLSAAGNGGGLPDIGRALAGRLLVP
jgi:hypothetical protein